MSEFAELSIEGRVATPGDADWDDIADRIQRSWRAVAPKKLTKFFDAAAEF